MTLIRAIALTASFASVPASAALIESRFDTDLEGFGVVADASVEHMLMGGNPGGFMQFNDFASGSLFFATVPVSALGDLSAANGETLSYDAIVLSGSGSRLSSFGRVIITGTSGSAEINIGAAPATNGVWTSYGAAMTAAAWGVTEMEWAALLSDVTSLTFQMEAINGDETVGLDNFVLMPAPGTLMLGAASVALIGRTRRRG